jgi:hypothetical protein
MAKRHIVLTIVAFSVLIPSGLARAQEGRRWPGAVYDSDSKGKPSGPPPKRDLTGVWEPAKDAGAGVSFDGAREFPVDGNPEHEPPYTPEGRAVYLANKPAVGARKVDSALSNDPYWRYCDPQGFPRIVLHNFRESQILQTPNQVVVLYMFNERWRVIWTDGREVPKDPENPGWSAVDGIIPPAPEPRWWGYSVGKWVDDYTFVDESTGFHDGTWLDTAGRPHSEQLAVEETYHRVDADHLELSIKITDPKYYTKPWVALDKLRLRLQSPHLDVYGAEMECSGSETQKYLDMFAGPAAEGDPGAKK